MSGFPREATVWLIASLAEVVGMLWLARQISTKKSDKISLAPELEESRIARKRSTEEKETDDVVPVCQLTRGEETQKLATYPPASVPLGEVTYKLASVSSESVSEREFAWHPPAFSKSSETKSRLDVILRNNILMQSLSAEGRSIVIEAYEMLTVSAGTIDVKE